MRFNQRRFLGKNCLPIVLFLIVYFTIWNKIIKQNVNFFNGDIPRSNVLSIVGGNVQHDQFSFTEQCTFALVCGHGDSDTISEMKPLIISAVLLSSCRLHFIILTDANSYGRINDTLHAELETTLKPVSFEIWKVSTRFIRQWANNFKFDTDGYLQKKRIWLTTKLYIPFLLRHYERLIVIDTDIIFLQDPLLLWDQFNDGNGSWSYKMPLNDMKNENTICSCVVLVNVKNVLSSNLYPTEFQKALQLGNDTYNQTTGLFRTHRVDQAVYYLLSKRRPEIFRTLHERFNVEHCRRYFGRFHSTRPIINKTTALHYNCAGKRFNGHETGEIFFRFYQTYRMSWLKGENRRSYHNQIKTFDDKESAALERFNLRLPVE